MSDLISRAEQALLQPADLTADAVAGVLGTLLQAEGPVFASLKIEPGPPPEMDYRMMHGAQIRDDFRAALDPEFEP